MTSYRVKAMVETVIEIDDEGLSGRQVKDALKEYFIDPCLVPDDVTLLSFEGISHDSIRLIGKPLSNSSSTAQSKCGDLWSITSQRMTSVCCFTIRLTPMNTASH